MGKNNLGGLKKVTSFIKLYIQGKLKENELFKRRRKSKDETTIQFKDIKDQIDIKPKHFSNKNIKKQNSFKSEPKDEIIDNIESSFNEESESDNENDIELQKNKIKKQINDILMKTDEKYKNLVKERNNYLLNYIQQMYKDSSDSNITDKIKSLFSSQKDNTNNEMKLIKEKENLSINKDLYITDKENFLKKEKTSPQKKIKENRVNIKNIKNIELSKINIPKEVPNSNIKKKYEQIDIKELINKIKQRNRENLIPIRAQNNKDVYQNLRQNLLNKNNDLISLAFTHNSRNKKKINSDIKTNKQNNSRIKYYSFHEQIQGGNLNSTMNKNEIKKININFSSFQENNKEKDEQKMKKIFAQIKDSLQEDEKFLIKNRFLKYGYSKDIIFAEDKSKDKNNK